MIRTWWFSLALVAMLAPTALARHDVEMDFDLRTTGDLEVEAVADARYDYRWEWGDGESSAGAHARHAYARPGVYRVVVVATDEAGREWRATREVEVRAAAPSPRVEVDVDGDVVRAEAERERGARFEWDWGDGRTSRGRVATHAYAEPGVYEVTLKVTHRDGSCTYERRTVVIEAHAHAPRAQAESEARAEARHETRARGPGVSASVTLGWHERDDDARAAPERTHEARGHASMRSSSDEHHEVPGVGAPLVAAALGVAGAGARAFGRRR